MKRLLILGSTGSIGTQALDVVARARRARARRPVRRQRAWEALVEQARAHGVRRIALADARRGRARRRGVDRRRGARAARGPRRAGRGSGADLVLNAIVGSAGLGPDGRGARRGHRPRARQQGVARRRRRARDGARRGDRRADPPGRLRALGAAPADRRRARPRRHDRQARAHRLRRPVPRALARRAATT